MQVTQLNLYPIKSTRTYSVNQAFVSPQGLNFDREFMITELDGTFITARKDEILYRLSAYPIANGIVIQYDANDEYCVALYSDFNEQQTSEVWGVHFFSKVASPHINLWLSKLFRRAVQLRWIGETSNRSIRNFEYNPMSFADSYPLLLTSTKSLEEVQKWTPIPISMEQFRPNIIIDGNIAFEEENWRRIKIGKVIFNFGQCCTRCIMITRNLYNFKLDENAEPFRTLKKHHTNEKGKPIFGIHLIPENSGVIRIGDQVTLF